MADPRVSILYKGEARYVDGFCVCAYSEAGEHKMPVFNDYAEAESVALDLSRIEDNRDLRFEIFGAWNVEDGKTLLFLIREACNGNILSPYQPMILTVKWDVDND